MEEISVIIADLAEQLGTTMTYLFSVMTKQATAEAIVIIIVTGIFLISMFFELKSLYKVFWRVDKTNMTYWERLENEIKGNYLAATILGWSVLNFVLLVIVLFNFRNLITCINNPEYWALMQIFRKI